MQRDLTADGIAQCSCRILREPVVIASPSEGVWVGRLRVADSGASQAKQVSYFIWSGGDGCTSDTGVEVQGLDGGWRSAAAIGPWIDRCLAPGRPGRAEGIPPLYGYGVPDLHLDNPTSAFAPVGICHSQSRRRRGSRPYNPGWIISVAKERIASPLKCRELAWVAISRSVQRVHLP